MARDKSENGAQCCFNKFECRLFISKFSQFVFYLSLSLPFISMTLGQPCCKCCNLSVSVVVNVWFITNGMCMKDNAHVVRTSRNGMSTTWNLCCCWCHSVKVCALAAQPF